MIGFYEAGMFEYTDTGRCVENGEKAFKVIAEIPGEGTTSLYFTTKENAETFIEKNK